VRPEVGHCHFSAGKKFSRASSKSKRNQRPSKELDQPGYQTFWIVDLRLAAEHAKQLLRSVAGKRKPTPIRTMGNTKSLYLVELLAHNQSLVYPTRCAARKEFALAPHLSFWRDETPLHPRRWNGLSQNGHVTEIL
jgi:hypothetical protein